MDENKNEYYIDKLKTTKGFLILLGFYIDKVAYITPSYYRYIHEDENADGFINSENNEFVYIKRRNFNKFLSFVLNDNISIKDWIDEFILENRRFVSQSHKFGKSTLFIKIDRRIISPIIDKKFIHSNLDIPHTKIPYLYDYIANAIDKYRELSRKK